MASRHQSLAPLGTTSSHQGLAPLGTTVALTNDCSGFRYGVSSPGFSTSRHDSVSSPGFSTSRHDSSVNSSYRSHSDRDTEESDDEGGRSSQDDSLNLTNEINVEDDVSPVQVPRLESVCTVTVPVYVRVWFKDPSAICLLGRFRPSTRCLGPSPRALPED